MYELEVWLCKGMEGGWCGFSSLRVGVANKWNAADQVVENFDARSDVGCATQWQSVIRGLIWQLSTETRMKVPANGEILAIKDLPSCELRKFLVSEELKVLLEFLLFVQIAAAKALTARLLLRRIRGNNRRHPATPRRKLMRDHTRKL